MVVQAALAVPHAERRLVEHLDARHHLDAVAQIKEPRGEITFIAEDEKSQKVVPSTITSTRQTHALMNRLKSEAGQENQLLEKLTTALNTKTTEVETVGELSPL